MITRFPASRRLHPAGILARLGGARDGATAVEFALTFPMIAMLVVAIMEFGMIMFVGVLMESGLRDASRYGITGYVESGLTRMERIVQIVGEHTLGLVDMAKVDFDVLVYPSFGDVGGEEFVDGNGNGKYDSGETFTDQNSNGTWDSDIGTPGPGDPGDVVVYRLEYAWPLMTPFASTFIGSFTFRSAPRRRAQRAW